MNHTGLIIGGVLLLAMVCVSLYGAVVLPPGARLPVHLGLAGYNRWVSKSVGLVLFPALGAVAYVVINVAVKNHQTHGGLGPASGVIIVLAVMLAAQIGALAVGFTRSRRG